MNDAMESKADDGTGHQPSAMVVRGVWVPKGPWKATVQGVPLGPTTAGRNVGQGTGREPIHSECGSFASPTNAMGSATGKLVRLKPQKG